MPAQLPVLTVFRLMAALMLVTIGLHAASPEADVEWRHGSAFDSATYEVALVQPNAIAVEQAAVAPLPDARFASTPLPSLPSASLIPAPRPDSTGPPPVPIVERQPAARAPPFA